VVPWRGPAIFTAEFARTIDMVISIGNAFTGFSPATGSTRQRRARRSARPPRRRASEAARIFLDARHVAVVIRARART